MSLLDLTPLVPEARPIVAAAADVFIRHTQPWFIGLLVHGSALKGGVIPGTYHMLAGTLPIPEATLEEALVRSRESLNANRTYLGNDLLHHGGGRLERTTRYICTDVWPILFSLLLLRERDLSIWRLTKEEAIAQLPEPVRSAAEEFLRLVCAHYMGKGDVSSALALIEQGMKTIQLAQKAACGLSAKP